MIGSDAAGRDGVRLDRLAVLSIVLAMFAQESVWLLRRAGPAVPTGAAVAISPVGSAVFAINAVVAVWNLAPSPAVLGTYTAVWRTPSPHAVPAEED